MSAADCPRPKVVLTQRVHEHVEALLRGHCDVIANTGEEPLPRAELLRRCQGAHAVMVFMPDRIDAAFVAHCPQLRIVAGALKGHDNIDVSACAQRDVWVTVCEDLLTEPTADLAMGLLIGVTRNVLAGDRRMRSGGFRGWRPILYGSRLQDKTLGIIGMGAVGAAIARRATGFGMNVTYADPRRRTTQSDAPATRLTLTELLAGSDVVMPLVHLNDSTRHLLDAEAIGRMRPDAIIVNVGRGSVVSEQAVVDALEHGRLAAYAADVFEMEDWAEPDRPAEVHHRLLADTQRTLLTPHIGSAIGEVRSAIELEAAENILAALDGRRPPGAVNLPALQIAG